MRGGGEVCERRVAAGGHPAAIPKSSRVFATYFFFFLAFFLAFFFFAIPSPPFPYGTQRFQPEPLLNAHASKAKAR
jgi:hypothetical protein